MKYIVICYAIHEKRIASHKVFESVDAAKEYIIKDANSVYEDAFENAFCPDDVYIEVLDNYAKVSANEYTWTWEIIDMNDANVTKKLQEFNATYTSVWDGGLEVNARCHVDKDTQMITRIGENDIGDNTEMLNCLEREYVTFDDTNMEYDVHNICDVYDSKTKTYQKEPNTYYY